MSGSLREMFLRLAFILSGISVLILSERAFAGNDTYQYDSLGRLVSVTYADGSSITYTYDNAGNRITVTQTAAP